MTIAIQMRDDDYRTLMRDGGLMEGTLALTSPTEGNFRKFPDEKPLVKYLKLTHGCLKMTAERIRLSLSIDLTETGINPVDAIFDESWQARRFLEKFVGD